MTQSIKRGSVTVQVYPTPTVINGKSYPAHSVVWHFNKKPFRKKFGKKNSLARAVAFAESKAVQLANGETAALKMTSADAASHARSVDLLKPHGIPIEVAVAQFVEGLKAKQNKDSFPAFSVVADKFILAKKADGTRSLHLKDLCSRIATLKEHFPYSISEITSAAINKALGDLQQKEGIANRTRNHYRATLSNCFNFAKANGMLPHDWHQFDYVPKLEERDDPVTIYTPENVKTLLWNAPKSILPAIVLACFCGIRHSEIQGNPKDGVKPLDWGNIDFKTGQVFIAEGKVRTAGQRFAHLPENAINWLRPHWKASGSICRVLNLSKALVTLASDCGLSWQHNAPRHSYISYRLAETKDIARVSEETGTSPATLRRRYRRPIAEGQWQKYFSLNPPTMARVVNRKPKVFPKSFQKSKRAAGK